MLFCNNYLLYASLIIGFILAVRDRLILLLNFLRKSTRERVRLWVKLPARQSCNCSSGPAFLLLAFSFLRLDRLKLFLNRVFFMTAITAATSQKLSTRNLTDEQLFNLCQKYGDNALHWRRKFEGLLPEVFRRRLYEKKGHPSIFVFASKLAGLSEEQVRRVLNLEKRFDDKPALQTLLVNGEVSVNKLARVASIATPENQKGLAQQVQVLSNRAIETLVRDEKYAAAAIAAELEFQNPDGLQKQLFESKDVHVRDS